MELLMPKENYVELGFWKNRNVYSYLEEFSRINGQKEAVVDQFNSYTYCDLNNRVKQLAGAFLKNGIQPGDVVSFQLPNWGEGVVIHQALLMIGAISNPLMPTFRKKELEYILNVSRTKILFIPYKFRNFNYLEMMRDLENTSYLQNVVVLDRYDESPSLISNKETFYSTFIESGYMHDDVFPVNEKTIALLMYTSGTTGKPKGVLHSHNTLLCEAETNIIPLFDLGVHDVIFMPSPIGHSSGLMMGLELPFIVGCKVVFQDIWDSKLAIEYILNEGVTWTLGATPFLRGITNEVEKLEKAQKEKLKLKAFACGGADVPPDLIIKSRKLLNCYVGRQYGSSETPDSTMNSGKDPEDKAAYTDGKPAEATSIKIIDDDGNELPRGKVGEIAIKGAKVFLGYLQPEFNENTFTKDEYFLTGDLGLIDNDGYIVIKGRKKDIIIRGGENISTKEIEDILYLHPCISNVAIVGMPDEVMGEKACAYVVLKEGHSFTFSEMIKFLTKQEIAKQKFPERLEIIEQLPMTASGKIQKFKLREAIITKVKTST